MTDDTQPDATPAELAERDEVPEGAVAPPNLFIRVEILPGGDMRVDPDDNVSISQLVMASWLVGRYADDMLTGATVARAEREARIRSLTSDHLPKRKN